MKFTYSEYERLIYFLMNSGYTFTGYGDYSHIEHPAILRHDIDTSLEKAVQMAELENSIGGGQIKSTYFVLISSDFYNVFSKNSLDCIYRIKELGHTIGLHFDEKKYISSDKLWEKELILESILQEKKILEEMTGISIHCVSMHVPSKMTLQADLKIPGMINSYSKEFFEGFKYVSDSFHRWREDVCGVVTNIKPKRLHVLTHAFWYNDIPMTRNESIRDYIQEGVKYRYGLIEANILPPGITLADCFADKSGDVRG